MADAKNTVLFPYETLKKLSMDAFQKFGFSEKEADIIQRLRETVSGTDGFLDKAKRYMDITELTPELLRLFIEKIVVHEKEVKWSKHAPQTVEIYYNGIGFIDKQHQDMESLQPLKTEEPRQAS